MVFYAIVISIPTLALLWWWWAHRQLARIKAPSWTRWALAAFVILHVVGFGWLFFSRGGLVNLDLPAWAVVSLYVWHMIAVPIAVLVATLLGLTNGARWLFHRVKPKANASFASQNEPTALATEPASGAEALNISRRQFLAAGAVGAPLAVHAGTFGTSLHQIDSFRVRSITVPIDGLPEALNGLTIAHVTDTHVGKFTQGKILDEIVERTNQLNCDLVLLTGDLIDFDLADLPQAVAMVSRLKGRFGTFLCEGNHDLFQSRQRFEQGCIDSGLNLLVNQGATLHIRGERVQILGLRWGWSNATAREVRGAAITENMAELEPIREPGAFQILLAHHPHAFDAAREAKIPLTLAGHTHGGQLNLTDTVGFGPMLYKYWSGLYQPGSKATAAVVGNGTGNWFPLRVQAPAEVLHITLQRA